MSADAVQILTAVGVILTAIGVILTSVLSYLTRREVKDVVKHTNSMKDELVAEVRAASIELGRKQEKDHPSG